jgi:endonuclease-3
MPAVTIDWVLERLTAAYGERRLRPDNDPLSTLVETILSQNTSDTNSRAAYASLTASFSGWEEMAEADVHRIAAAIRSGGLADIKAVYIKQALQEIQRQRGRIELDFLNYIPLDEARDWLKALPGVGTKTASCVLLFSLGRPALPVDTHVYRVSQRLALVGHKDSVEQAQKSLEAMVPPQDVYAFHLLMIEHGRRVCKAQRPRCPECVLGERCPSYEIFRQSSR